MSQHVKLTWHGGRAKREARRGLAAGLGKATEHLLTESRKVVPLEEGTLERSGVASVDESALQAAVSYDTVYAVRQHEELDWRHAPGRTAKYLENPLNEQRETMVRLIGAEVATTLTRKFAGET